MKKNHLLWLSVAAVLGLQSCGQDVVEGTTESGFPYVHYVRHAGPHPQPGDVVEFHAYQFLGDSVVFSTRERGRPASVLIPTARVKTINPSPIVEAVRLMAVGDSMSVFYPLDSLPRKPRGYEDVSEVRYDVVVTAIKSQKQVAAEQKEEAEEAQTAKARESEVAQQVAHYLEEYQAGLLDDQLVALDSGLLMLLIEPGRGAEVQMRRPVEVHYYGVFEADGKMFDNSFQRGQPFQFRPGLGMVIKGWDMAVPRLREGGKAILFIPAHLAYGKAGSPPAIPPDANLVFYVEVVKVGK